MATRDDTRAADDDDAMMTGTGSSGGGGGDNDGRGNFVSCTPKFLRQHCKNVTNGCGCGAVARVGGKEMSPWPVALARQLIELAAREVCTVDAAQCDTGG